MNQMNGQLYPDWKGFWKRDMEKYGIRKLPREITRPFLVTATARGVRCGVKDANAPSSLAYRPGERRRPDRCGC